MCVCVCVQLCMFVRMRVCLCKCVWYVYIYVYECVFMRASLVVFVIKYAYKRLFANAHKFKSTCIYTSIGLVRTGYEYLHLSDYIK